MKNDIMISSLDITMLTGYEHDFVLIDIEETMKSLDDPDFQEFKCSFYTDSEGDKHLIYELTKIQALVMAGEYDEEVGKNIIDFIKLKESVEDEIIVNSIRISKLTGKKHIDVLMDIDNILESSNASEFGKVEYSFYKDSEGQEHIMFELTKRQALLIACGYDMRSQWKIMDYIELRETMRGVRRG